MFTCKAIAGLVCLFYRLFLSSTHSSESQQNNDGVFMFTECLWAVGVLCIQLNYKLCYRDYPAGACLIGFGVKFGIGGEWLD